MSTTDEMKSLTKEPLPLQVVKFDPPPDRVTDCPATVVLDRIIEIDNEMLRIQNSIAPHMAYLTVQRDQLMQRALTERIMNNAKAALIGVEGRKNRNDIEDLEAFQLAYPTEYRQIRERQKKDIDDAHEVQLKDLEDSDIPLGLADEIVGKKKVTEFVGYQPVKITYKVCPVVKGK